MKKIELGIDKSEHRKEPRPFGKGFLMCDVGAWYDLASMEEQYCLSGEIRGEPFSAIVGGREVEVVPVEKVYPPKIIETNQYKKFTKEEMLAVGKAAKISGKVLEVLEGIIYFHGSGMSWWDGNPVASEFFYRGEKIVVDVTEDVAVSPELGVKAGRYTFLVPNGDSLPVKRKGGGIPICAGETRDGEGSYRGRGDDRIVGYKALFVPDV